MEPEILTQVDAGVGTITLNRPRALNALSLPMIRSLYTTLSNWREDPHVQVVLLQGNGEKAFCAGGDIRAVYEAGKAEHYDLCDAFFREEYTLNTLIRQYPKPYISMIHGIAMGGGLGVSVNGKYRILSETALMAMPETGIGFFPDVGATTFLSAAPSKIGLYLALSGARLETSDALYAGLGTHHIPLAHWDLFKTALKMGKDVETAIHQYAKPLGTSVLEKDFAPLEDHFSKSSVEDILEDLARDTSPLGEKCYEILKTKSPLSLKIAFAQLTKHDATCAFSEAMKREFRISQHLIHSHDFYEGVRAVLVDKDQSPHWSPSALQDVTTEMVQSYFNPLGEKELTL